MTLSLSPAAIQQAHPIPVAHLTEAPRACGIAFINAFRNGLTFGWVAKNCLPQIVIAHEVRGRQTGELPDIIKSALKGGGESWKRGRSKGA